VEPPPTLGSPDLNAPLPPNARQRALLGKPIPKLKDYDACCLCGGGTVLVATSSIVRTIFSGAFGGGT